jgi:hypothetical protein
MGLDATTDLRRHRINISRLHAAFQFMSVLSNSHHTTTFVAEKYDRNRNSFSQCIIFSLSCWYLSRIEVYWLLAQKSPNMVVVGLKKKRYFLPTICTWS